MIELPLSLVDGSFGLLISGRLFRRQIGIAPELGKLCLRILLQRDKSGPRSVERAPRLIELLWRDGIGARKRGVAIVGALRQKDLRILGTDLAEHAFVLRLLRFDVEHGLRERRLSIFQSDLEGPGIEAEQHLAGLYALTLMHVDVLDQSG